MSDHAASPPSAERIEGCRDAVCRERSLTPGDAFPDASTGWVGTVRGPAGEDWVLKVAWAHDEARDETEGLRLLARHTSAVPVVHHAQRDGNVAVLLMDRVLPGTTLANSRLSAEQEDEVVAALLTQIWIPAPQGGPFRPLAQMCTWWADESAARLAEDPRGLPAEVIAEGLDLFRSLPGTWSGDAKLLATDFHHHNVLAATEEPSTDPSDWRVIDTKPYVGDPHYDLTQHMLNDPERLVADPSAFAARMAGLTGLDPERARRWLLARCVQETGVMDGAAEVALRLAGHVS